ncbi:MAG: 50S ribosomal protein L21 [Parvibaculales bacterium]
MYAVVRTGGKQYRVAKDDVIELERLAGDAGDKIKLTDVLMIGEAGKKPTIGTPVVSGASVTAEVIEQTRGDKIDVIKFKRRHNYRRQLGHRQDLTKVKITAISKSAPKKAAPKKAAKDASDDKE